MASGTTIVESAQARLRRWSAPMARMRRWSAQPDSSRRVTAVLGELSNRNWNCSDLAPTADRVAIALSAGNPLRRRLSRSRNGMRAGAKGDVDFDRLGIGAGTNVIDVGCGAGKALL